MGELSEHKKLSDDLGAVLWRRVYEARAALDVTVMLNTDTLRRLLEQAGIPEPSDDAILWGGRSVHGRTMKAVDRG